MDRFSLSGTFYVILLTFSILLPVFITALDRLEIVGYNLSPQVESSDLVELQCYGRILDQQPDEFFENGGRLVWLADGEIIAYSTLEHREEFVADHDKYSIAVHNLSTHNNAYIVQLTIDQISIDDSKEYFCALFSAQNETTARSRPKFVNVHYAPDQLYPQCIIDSTPNNLDMVTLKCRSQTAFPNVRVNWMSPEGRAIGSASESDGFTESKLDVEIPIINTEYVCVLNYSGNYEEVSRKCKVYPPIVSLKQPDQEVVEGGNAVFTCSVSAKPESLSEHGIKWTSFPLLKSRNTTIFNNDDHSFSQLVINNVTAKDNGTEIICHSQNLLGENHQRAIVIVKTYRSSTGIYVPPFKVAIEPQIARVPEGDIASFECDVSTYKNSYMYKWYFKEEEIDSESMPEKFSIEQTSQRLRVLSVDDADNNATVACVVMADGKKKTARATLLVIKAPALDASQKDPPDSDYMTEVWKLVIPISGGLVSFSLVVLLIWVSCKTKGRCGDKNDRGHIPTESVAYVPSMDIGQTTFNNSPRSINSVSRATAKTVNHDRFLVNLPPVPPIPTEDDEQDADALRVAMKLGALEDYEDMERVRSNYYHQHEIDELNHYQHVIERLEKPTNHQENVEHGKQGGGGEPPLY